MVTKGISSEEIPNARGEQVIFNKFLITHHKSQNITYVTIVSF